MGLFDQLESGLRGALGDLAGQAMGQLEANAPALLSQVLGKTDLGSVGGLLAKLQEGGLSDQVSSWLGNGANLSITPEQVREALGNEHVQQIANSIGVPTDKVLEMMSKYLPGAVDKMSPNGTLDEPTDT
jgi:uncharacterized protein YidB (DUF937 family)